MRQPIQTPDPVTLLSSRYFVEGGRFPFRRQWHRSVHPKAGWEEIVEYSGFDFSTHAKTEQSYGVLFEFEFYVVIYDYVKLMPVYTLCEQHFPFVSPSENYSQFLHYILWEDLFSIRNNSKWHLLNIPYGLSQCCVLCTDDCIRPPEAVIVINLLW